jgi:hypothetical protein
MEGRIADRRAERPALDLRDPERPTIREVSEARLREARKVSRSRSPTPRHSRTGRLSGSRTPGTCSTGRVRSCGVLPPLVGESLDSLR